MGGYNYILNLVSALSKYEYEQIQPIIFCGVDYPRKDLEPFRQVSNLKIVVDSSFDKKMKNINLLSSILWGYPSNINEIFEDNNIGVIFENARFYGWRNKAEILSWLPDFQHRHMPHLFSGLGWWKRDVGFRIQILLKRNILLSSESSKKDLQRFYKANKNNIHVLKFPGLINKERFISDRNFLIKKYEIPEVFFYVPNQLWVHKNHELLIRALHVLKMEGIYITVICTGNTLDPRKPKYLEYLESKISDLDLKKQFKILGLIPRAHAMCLLRTCTAVINPSFFEGWNSSVEEAKAFGVPLILSDLNVHREQVEGKGYFFDPNSLSSLVDVLRVAKNWVHPDKIRCQTKELKSLERDFANNFCKILKDIT